MDTELECFEFLDLSDVDVHEKNRLKQSLSISNDVSEYLELPWEITKGTRSKVNETATVLNDTTKLLNGKPENIAEPRASPQPSQIQSSNQDVPPTQALPPSQPQSQSNSAPINNVYTPPGQNPYSVPYQSVPYVYVSTMTANVNVHGYGNYAPHHYSPNETELNSRPSRGRGHGSRPGKRSDYRNDSSMAENAQVYVPPAMAMVHHPYHYVTMPHPTAQHATGSPIFLYPPSVYPTYQPTPPTYYQQPAVNTEYQPVMEDVHQDMSPVQQPQQQELHIYTEQQPAQQIESYKLQKDEENPRLSINDSSNAIRSEKLLTSNEMQAIQSPESISNSSVPVNLTENPKQIETVQVVERKVPEPNSQVSTVESKTEKAATELPNEKGNSVNMESNLELHSVTQTSEETYSHPGANECVKPEKDVKLEKHIEQHKMKQDEHKPTETAEAAPERTSPVQKSWASLFSSNASASTATKAANMNVKSASKPLAMVSPFTQEAQTPQQASTPMVSSPKPQRGEKIATRKQKLEQITDPNAYRIGEFLAKYNMDNKAVSLLPRGLTNRSNYCYINSILQALLACPPFYNLIRAIPTQNNKRNASKKSSTPIIDSIVELVDEFSPLPPGSRVNRREKGMRKDEADITCGPPFEPAWIYKILSGIRTDTFNIEGRQEDAEEFLGLLLNGLNDEMLELIKLSGDDGIQVNGSSSGEGDQHESDEDEWKVMGPKNKGSITRRTDFGRTPISDIFQGQLRSRVHRSGDHSTDNVQPFFTLQLDIEKATSVREALEILVNKDQIEGVTCSKTNQEVEAWQQVTLEELPSVLILHLKCFDYKLDTCSKIIKAIEFPIDLKIDPKLLSSKSRFIGKQKQYKLFAVTYHDGKEATKGHYITDAFHIGYNSWIRYDDSSVKAIQENLVLHPNGNRVPYLLYYRRCDTIGQPQNKKD